MRYGERQKRIDAIEARLRELDGDKNPANIQYAKEVDNLGERLEALAEKSDNANMWSKISKGFNAVKNSSIGLAAVGVAGMMATMAYGHTINNPEFTMDLGNQLLTTVSIGYAGLAGAVAGYFGKKKSDEIVMEKSKGIDASYNDLKGAASDLQYSTHKIENLSITNRKNGDAMYDKIFGADIKSPAQKEQDEVQEKRTRRNGLARN